jgi:hypothetical protein
VKRPTIHASEALVRRNHLLWADLRYSYGNWLRSGVIPEHWRMPLPLVARSLSPQ